MSPADRPVSADPTASTAHSPPELVRVMGRWTLAALMLNSIVGAGVYGLPSIVDGLLGPAAPLAYVVAALGVGVVMACFAEVGSQFPTSGGLYVYAREAFGRFAGIQMGWLALMVRVAAHGAIASLLVTYLGEFVPGITAPLPRALTLLAVLGALTIVNVLGVRNAALLSNLFTVAKLVPLVLIGLVGLVLASDRLPSPFEAAAPGAWGQAVLALMFAFGGFESAVSTMGEARDPRRDLPFALGVGLLGCTAVYLAVHLAVMAALPDPSASARPVADAARALLGPGAAAFVAVGAVLSIVGILSAGILNTPRLAFALARSGDFPAALGAVHPIYRTPYISIVLYASAVTLTAIAGGFVWNAVLSAVARLLTYAVVCAALIRLRQTRPGADAWRLPGGRGFALLGLLLAGTLVSRMGVGELIVIAVTMVLAFAHWRRVVR
jgi:amino acid transporter